MVAPKNATVCQQTREGFSLSSARPESKARRSRVGLLKTTLQSRIGKTL
jgi:hypothetical protein